MNIKKLKRREEKEGNNIKKRSKSYTKKGKKVSAERISEAAISGAGARDLIFHKLCGPVERKKSLTWAAQVR